MRYMRMPKDATVTDLRNSLKRIKTTSTTEDKESARSAKIRIMRVTEVRNVSSPQFQTYVGEVFQQGAQRLKQDLSVYESSKIFCDDEPRVDQGLGSGKEQL